MPDAPLAEHYLHLGIHSAEIFVRDIKRSADFFASKLGFTVRGLGMYEGQEIAVVSPPSGGLVLVLVAPSPGSADEQLVGRRTGLNLLTNELAHRHDEWVARGVTFLRPPTVSPAGAITAEFQDLDGNIFRMAEADAMTQRLEADRRAEAARLERERHMAREMEIARHVQSRLFPQVVPDLPQLECAGACWPAQQVGGDYYDFLRLDDTRLAIAIGDVAGKGIAAALLMAGLQASVRGGLTRGATDLPGLVADINRAYFESSPDASYATMFMGVYDDTTGTLRYVNCGHLPPLLIRARGAVERLNPTGTVLGMFDRIDCRVGTVDLLDGDLLVLYTDGVSEARNSRDHDFGEEGIVAAVTGRTFAHASDVLHAVAEAVSSHAGVEHEDDVTVVTARRLPRATIPMT